MEQCQCGVVGQCLHGVVRSWLTFGPVVVVQEKKLESLEEEHEQTQSDLRLAFKRIHDLQSIEDSVASDSDDR